MARSRLMAVVLLLVDAQQNMLLPPEPVAGAEQVGETIARLLDRARGAGAMVVHIRNSGSADDPDAPGSDGWQLVHQPLEREPVIDKWESDAFAGTPLAEVVPAGAELVVAGMQSDYCIRATTLSALGRGHRVTLVRGAHATYDDGQEPATEISRRVELELAGAGATVVGLDEVVLSG